MTEERGWIIETGEISAPDYASVDMGLKMTDDPLKAIRFARDTDATAFALVYLPGVETRISEL